MQTRAGADRAKAELNGILLHDLELKIGWGKSIVIPPAPLYPAESVGISSAPLKPSGAAVPPPGVDAAPPWTEPHRDGKIEPVGELPCHHQTYFTCCNSFSSLHVEVASAHYFL